MASDMRNLYLKRDERGVICLHDEETGRMIAAQTKVCIDQLPGEPSTVTVTFLADKLFGLRIEIDDGE